MSKIEVGQIYIRTDLEWGEGRLLRIVKCEPFDVRAEYLGDPEYGVFPLNTAAIIGTNPWFRLQTKLDKALK